MLKTAVFFMKMTAKMIIAKETIKVLFMYKTRKLILNTNIASHSKMSDMI